MVTVSDKFLN